MVFEKGRGPYPHNKGCSFSTTLFPLTRVFSSILGRSSERWGAQTPTPFHTSDRMGWMGFEAIHKVSPQLMQKLDPIKTVPHSVAHSKRTPIIDKDNNTKGKQCLSLYSLLCFLEIPLLCFPLVAVIDDKVRITPLENCLSSSQAAF